MATRAGRTTDGSDGGRSGGRERGRDLALAAIALVLAAAAAAHGALYLRSFNVRPPGPKRAAAGDASVPAPATPAPARPAPGAGTTGSSRPRVVLVVVDGLRDDRAGALGLEGTPARTGAAPPLARCTLEAYWPTYSLPGYATIATGASPALTGVHNNRFRGPVTLDSLFARARAAGRSVGAVTDRGDVWAHMFPADLGGQASGAQAFARATEGLFTDAAPDWDLTLLHTLVVDDAGHEEGAASGSYARAVAATGVWLRAAISRLDPGRDTLVVASDHGHIDRGGHGGTEPEVVRVPLFLIGRGVRDGAPGETCAGRHLSDVAPTVAVLLGVDPPRQATGRVLRALLDLEPSALDAAEAAGGRARVDLAAGPGVRADDANAATGAGLGSEVRSGALGASAAAALIWLLILVAGPVKRPAGAARLRAWAAAAAYPAAAWLVLLFLEPGASYSARRGTWVAYALRLVLLLSGAAVVGLGAHAFAFARSTPDVRRHARALALGGAAASWPVVVGLYGSPFARPLGDPHLSFAVVLAVAVTCVGCGYVALLLLADAAGIGGGRPAPPGPRSQSARGE